MNGKFRKSLTWKKIINIHLFPISTGRYKSVLLPCLEIPCICGIWNGRSVVGPKLIPKPVSRLELGFFWVSDSSAGAGMETSLVRMEPRSSRPLWMMR